MFKKRVKISNSHVISNKDKKNLKESLVKLGYGQDFIDQFFDDKNYEDEFEEDAEHKIAMDKVHGTKVVLYSRGGTPFLFSVDQKHGPTLPTMYFMLKMAPTLSITNYSLAIEGPKVLPVRIFLKQGVENFIFKGADLMWPGIFAVDACQDEEEERFYRINQIAIVYALNSRKKVDRETEKKDEPEEESKEEKAS